MNEEEVRRRLRLGEDSGTEFKSVARTEQLADKDRIARTVCAFANSGGGAILLGVEDDGTVTGTGDRTATDRLLQQLSSVCNQKVQPSLPCRHERHEIDGHIVVVTEVPGGLPDRPFSAGGIYLVRDGAVSRPATKHELRRLLEAVDYHFDRGPIPGTSFADLDDLAVRDLLRLSVGDGVPEDEARRYLQDRRCITSEGEVTRAGLLVLGRKPQRHMPDACIVAVRWPGTEVGDRWTDRAEHAGRLSLQYEGALQFLNKHLHQGAALEGSLRREIGIPEDVLREAIVNALVHRDYRAQAQTQVFVFDDRVEIQNPGGLLNSLSVDDIREGASLARNPEIALLLRRLLLREGLGLGIRRITRLMLDRGLPAPEIEGEGWRFRLVLRTSTAPGT